jgi:hypothetical protein
MAEAKVNDDFIDVSEVTASPRGRKPELDQGLVDLLASIPEGKAARLTKTFGAVPKEKRQAVGAVIRKHWKAVYGEVKPRIDFTPEGVPQVRAR